MENKLIQKAGENSNLIQVKNLNIGLTQEEVKKYIAKENEIIIAKCNIMARDVAMERLNNYTKTLLPKLVKNEILSAFSEPDFQFAYKSSQKTAMCTERKADYEMLSELLIHKFNNKDNYTVSATVEKAIDEVNHISKDSLMILTVLFSLRAYSPNSEIASKGIDALEELYKKLLNNFELPETTEWIDNLEVINAIRVNTFTTSKKLDDYFCEKFVDYTKRGIKKDSQNYIEIVEKLKNSGIPLDILIDNEIDKEYVRLSILRKEQINDVIIEMNIGSEITIKYLTMEQRDTLFNIFDSYDNETVETKNTFKNMMYSKENFKKLIDWWNNNMINISIDLTSIGRVLAYTNAKRIDNTLPEMK